MQEKESSTGKSIEECSHSHPYEYLTKLNQVFHNCNKSGGKDYSAASKIKLPFYKFNQIKIPSCFAIRYAEEHKELVNFHSVQVSKMDDGDRKLWKEHREIIQSYLKHKKSGKHKPVKNKNSNFVDKIIEKDKNNIFLKKIIEKGTTFEYDQSKLEQEVLAKLKKNSNTKSRKLARCQTAKCMSTQGRFKVEDSMNELSKQKIGQNEYLDHHHEHQLVQKYKDIMRKADFSISDKNIRKTCDLIAKMQKIAQNKEQK